MTRFFQEYFIMALVATIVILVVLALRPIFARFSKRIASLLWIVVFFRLLCPVTLEGPIPAFWNSWIQVRQETQVELNEEVSQNVWEGQDPSKTEMLGPGILFMNMTGQQPSNAGAQAHAPSKDAKDGISNPQEADKDDIAVQKGGVHEEEITKDDVLVDRTDRLDRQVTKATEKQNGKTLMQGVNPWTLCGWIWAIGAVICLAYGIICYVRLLRKLREAIPMSEWEGYQVKISDVSGVPMSFGVFHPGIYVPPYFTEGGDVVKLSAMEREMILHHEAMHIKRRDPLWKLLSLLALCLHWWNPFVWLSIHLFHKDMEMACDEGVLAKLGQEQKKDYAQALLHFAQSKNGISLAVAFGESNAESRIKEALRYRKRPLWLSVTLTCFVVLLGGCLALNPKEDEQKESSDEESMVQGEELVPYGAKRITDEGYYVYEYESQVIDNWKQLWPDLLISQGKIKKEDAFSYYGASIYVDEEGSHSVMEGEPREIYTYATSQDEQGNVTHFRAVLDVYKYQAEYYFVDAQLDDNETIETAREALKFQPRFQWETLVYGFEGGKPEFFSDLGHANKQLDEWARIYQEQDPEKYQALLDPVTAVELLMHLRGGKGEFCKTRYDNGMVTYTFADGSKIHYGVICRHNIWCPQGMLETSEEMEKHPEYPVIGEVLSAEKREQNAKEFYDRLTSVTSETLHSVTKCLETTPYLNAYWEGGAEGDYLILKDLPDKDVCLYGIYGGMGMALRVGDAAYPVWLKWYHSQMPQFYAGDYDGDGEMEYIIVTSEFYSSDPSTTRLYLLEIQDGEAILRPFEGDERRTLLSEHLDYQFSSEQKQLTLYVDKDLPSETTCSFDLSHMAESWLERNPRPFLGRGETVFVIGDKIYYEAAIGIRVEHVMGQSNPLYDAQKYLYCELQYQKDGTIQFGDMELRDYDWALIPDKLETPKTITYVGEEIINERQADLNGDGFPETLVTSVTYKEADRDLPLNERLKQGEVCYIRVYNGTPQMDQFVYVPEQYEKTGGYNADVAIWELMLSDDPDGYGLLYLCHKNGENCLLIYDRESQQGAEGPKYHVFRLTVDGMEFLIDRTDNLNDYVRGGELIAMMDEDSGLKIPVWSVER